MPERPTTSSAGPVALNELDRIDFGAWRNVARRELSHLLLFRWDPDEVVGDYPESADWYGNVADSIVLGLWMGDDRDLFRARMRSQRRNYTALGCDDESLDRMWSLVESWLPRSLSRWWREHIDAAETSLPCRFNLIDDHEARPLSRTDWIEATATVASRAIEEAGVGEMRSNVGYRPCTASDVADQIRKQLEGDDVLIDHYRWSSPDLGLILRICMDEDLHVSSASPLDATVRWASDNRLLRDA